MSTSPSPFTHRSRQLGPDVMPVVWSELLASDNATSGALDGYALFNGDGPGAVAPLVDGRRLDTQAFRQGTDRSEMFGRVHDRLKWSVHAPHYKALPKCLQGIASTKRQTGY